ncbi:unnamed protein product [Microthlaspi erraticum]|uniref:DUF295 domain-containing protein n=1 Tax=Microthlaspi erraticum TaxID=1685480 RepID=A0A6D2HKZ9_9BRAS|nr:unnamed protein product [Microthlaspi erraticum]
MPNYTLSGESEKLSYIKAPLASCYGDDAIFIEYKGKLASIVPDTIMVVSKDLICANKAGELILAPTMLSRHAQPFYIFYYNVETQTSEESAPWNWRRSRV